MSILTRYSLRRAFHLMRFTRCYSEIPDRDKPVTFTTSEAASWRAEYSRRGGNIYDDSAEQQPYIVSLSLGVFLLYFLYLREESDIDERFDIGKNIFDRVEDLEEVQLKVVREDYIKKGKDVKEIDIRLRDLERIRLEKTG